MFDILILPLAKDDIKEAAEWYNSKQIGLGKRFTQEIQGKVKILRKNPEMFSIQYGETRTAILDIFPFMIHYKIRHQDNLVLISAIFHTSLNPNRWKQRK